MNNFIFLKSKNFLPRYIIHFFTGAKPKFLLPGNTKYHLGWVLTSLEENTKKHSGSSPISVIIIISTKVTKVAYRMLPQPNDVKWKQLRD